MKIRSTKFEIRKNFGDLIQASSNRYPVWKFKHLNFEFVSDFDIQISEEEDDKRGENQSIESDPR